MNKTRSKTKLGIKSSQSQPGDKLLRKKKIKTTRKKDEENILSKDIDVEEEMKEIERLGERRLAKTREAHMNYTRGSIVNLKFKPQKYKGSFMPYHLRWIFNNTVKSNEIVLLQEIEGLEVN